jgi:flagellar biosynthesis protein FlhB
MADYAGEKTLEPTPHRRQQARQQGHVAKSHDLASAAVLLAGLGLLLLLGGSLVGFLFDYCRSQLGGEAWQSIDSQFVVDHWNAMLWGLARYLLPILGLICAAGVAINVLQAGFLFLPQKLAPDFANVDPLSGLRRIFSADNLVRLALGMFKVATVAVVAGVVLYSQRDALLGLSGLAPSVLARQFVRITIGTGLKVGAGLLVLAVLDYAYQRWRYEQDLKMTPQELREELRNLEGDRSLVARRKQMQRDLAMQRVSEVSRQEGKR